MLSLLWTRCVYHTHLAVIQVLGIKEQTAETQREIGFILMLSAWIAIASSILTSYFISLEYERHPNFVLCYLLFCVIGTLRINFHEIVEHIILFIQKDD